MARQVFRPQRLAHESRLKRRRERGEVGRREIDVATADPTVFSAQSSLCDARSWSLDRVGAHWNRQPS
jgi:hypothetical protein